MKKMTEELKRNFYQEKISQIILIIKFDTKFIKFYFLEYILLFIDKFYPRFS